MKNKHPVRFGLQTGQQNVAWPDLLDLWRKADQWGYDSLWNFDHFYAIFTDPADPCLEGWTTLSALAQSTSRARIGHLVTGNTYRHPCLTAKMAVSLDHISSGRLNLGIGAGWFELEHTSLGLDFKNVRGRLEALEEALKIIRGMFAGEKVTLRGKHYSVTEAFSHPGPVQAGGPPIMLGGEGKVGFGSDFDGIECKPEQLDNPLDYPRLLDKLRQRGYSQSCVRDIAGEAMISYFARL